MRPCKRTRARTLIRNSVDREVTIVGVRTCITNIVRRIRSIVTVTNPSRQMENKGNINVENTTPRRRLEIELTKGGRPLAPPALHSKNVPPPQANYPSYMQSPIKVQTRTRKQRIRPLPLERWVHASVRRGSTYRKCTIPSSRILLPLFGRIKDTTWVG